MKIKVCLKFASISSFMDNYREEVVKETEFPQYVERHVNMYWGDDKPMPCVKYYSKDGGFIGDEQTCKMLIEKYGIAPERASANHNVCSIGYSTKYNKFFGWSHRAISGFKTGDKIRLGDCAYLPENSPESILQYVQNFWNDPHYIVELEGTDICRWSPDYNKLRAKYGKKFFYEWHPLDWIKAFGTAKVENVWPRLKDQGYMICERTPLSEYKTGKGEYVIRNDQEARQAAKHFAESVSSEGK